MRALLLVAMLGAPALGAVAGVPLPPLPGGAPMAWAGTGNDNLSAGVLNRDDHRTGMAQGGYLGEHLALGLDYSLFTNKAAAGGRGSRSDQLTATAGWTALDGTGDWSPLLVVGGGVRALGDYGGESLQEELHRYGGYPVFRAPYDDEDAVDGLAFAAGRIQWLQRTPAGFSWIAPPGRWGMVASAAGLATAGGEVEGEVELHVLYAGTEGATWLGARARGAGGTLPGASAAAVAEHERGLWLVAGMSVQPAGQPFGVWASVGANPHERAALGTVGASWRPGESSPAREGQRVEFQVGYHSGAVVGYQFRWVPLALQDADAQGFARWVRHEVLLDYRCGGTPGVNWRDMKMLSDQALIGHAPTLVMPPIGGVLRVAPYGYGALGLRIERATGWGPQPRFRDKAATRGVAQMGAGVRLSTHLGDTHPSVEWLDRVRLGFGYDRWFPFQRQEIGDASDHDYFQRVNWSLGAMVGIELAW